MKLISSYLSDVLRSKNDGEKDAEELLIAKLTRGFNGELRPVPKTQAKTGKKLVVMEERERTR